ncbi:MAG: methyltransferase domain-containing protein [Thermoplasmatales archaeon]|nr:MAG: methyltransferase domain-containing protein [Thermoplasmatales archaeon]
MEKNKKLGDNSKKYNYTLRDKFNIKKSNFFWKWVDILSFKLDKIEKIYIDHVSKEYIREFNMFDINDAKNILHIGCGSYPITAITLYRFNGGNIIGIDRSKKAVERAKNLIAEKQFNDRVKIMVGDGSEYSPEGFDTIIVSGCSIPKLKVLENLINKAEPKSRIIVRESCNISNVVSKYLGEQKDKVKIDKHMINKINNKNSWESFLLIKK